MRIGLLSGKTLSEHHLSLLQPILQDRQFEVALVVIDARPPKTVRQKVIENLRRGCGAYILVRAIQSFLPEPARGIETEEFCRKNDVEFLETGSPYSPEIAERIRAYQLDLMVLLCGFGIIPEPLLSVCPKGILSYHHGDMRKYRGMPPGLWELYHGEREIGITVQKIAARLDRGIPIEEKHLPIYPTDTLRAVRERLKAHDQGMLYAALKKMADPDFQPTLIQEFGKVYTLPNFRQWVTLHTRIAYRRLRCRLPARSGKDP